MARVTRSSRREMDLNHHDHHDQSNLNPSVPSFLPLLQGLQAPNNIRHVLGELPPTQENQSVPQPKSPMDIELKGLKAAFRSAIGIKKKKKPKKSKTLAPDVTDTHDVESLQESCASSLYQSLEQQEVFRPAAMATTSSHPMSSTPTQESGQSESTLLSSDHSGSHRTISQKVISSIKDGQFEIFRTLEMANHSIVLADGVRKQLEALVDTPEVKACLQQQSSVPDHLPAEMSSIDDKMPTSKTEVVAVESDDDSFVQAITSRSPAKPVSRVDDYVDELDKLEDVIEALDEATSPNLKAPDKGAFLSGKHGSSLQKEQVSRIFSPTDIELAKLRHEKSTTTTVTKTDGYRSLRLKTKVEAVSAPKSIPRKTKSTQLLTTTRKVSDQSARTLSRASSVTALSKRPVTAPAHITRGISRAALNATASKQATQSTITRSTTHRPGEAMAQKAKDPSRRVQRESDDTDSRAGSVVPKIKSTKPPTKPTFELPGEAISRRKREAHEARVKKQEEEEKKRREFKARPARASFVPSAAVRETAASRARQGLAATHSHVDTGSGSTAKSAAHAVVKRASTTALRPPFPPAAATDAHASLTHARPPAAALTHRNLTPHTSIVGTARLAATPKAGVAAATRTVSEGRRAKEGGGGARHERAGPEGPREKREKEEVTRRVREEAAERGRVASREWAEKQRVKATAAAAAAAAAAVGTGEAGSGPGR